MVPAVLHPSHFNFKLKFTSPAPRQQRRLARSQRAGGGVNPQATTFAHITVYTRTMALICAGSSFRGVMKVG